MPADAADLRSLRFSTRGLPERMRIPMWREEFGRHIVHVDIEPTQIGRVFNPDLGIVSDARAALELFIEVAKERKAASKLKNRKAWAAACEHRKKNMLRRSQYDQVPLKPQRVYQEMNDAFGRDTTYVTTI